MVPNMTTMLIANHGCWVQVFSPTCHATAGAASHCRFLNCSRWLYSKQSCRKVARTRGSAAMDATASDGVKLTNITNVLAWFG